MFELRDVSLLAAARPEERVLLGDVRACFVPGELTALIGPPGCGKRLLLQVLAGVRQPTFGEVLWNSGDPRPSIAYYPGLPLGHDRVEAWLTPSEQLASALRLRVASGASAVATQTASLLEKTGLAEKADTLAGALTRAEHRRLELALELAGSPGLLLWDERDGGIDADFDRLLRELAASLRIAIVRVTDVLDRLGDFDTVLVLAGGHLAYDGPPDCLLHYFQVDTPGQLFGQLGQRDPGEWHRSWEKHRSAYNTGGSSPARTTAPATSTAPLRKPGAASQVLELLRRRGKAALRDRRAMARALTLTLLFPLGAAAFASGGLERFIGLAERLRGDVIAQIRENALLAVDATYGVQLASGLALAQFLLLAFLTGHLAGREIAGERRFLEREKFRGLGAAAYVAAKAACLLPVVLLQALWMGVYIHTVCRLPGGQGWQAGVLALANAAFACICLAISSFATSPERARRLCYALALLQLPFSGLLLAPPEWLSWALRPLSTLYWGSSVYLESMHGTRFHEILRMVDPLGPPELGLAILGVQLILGLILCFAGCKMNRLRVAPGI